MAECTLRAFTQADGDWLREWFQTDAQGLGQFLGFALENEGACIAGFNSLFSGCQRGTAQFWMIEREEEPIGFVALTDVPATMDIGRVHIYIEPTQRRYSLRAARAAQQTITALGFKRLVATQARDNKAAAALAKRVGFLPHPMVVLEKQLHPEG
jgi:RimJ/RimL family protein N-acetyltransferase